jgi:hypothetical protein
VTYWQNASIFQHIADELAKDRVVFLTGAGISYKLPGEASRSLPSWLDLLGRLRSKAEAKHPLPNQDREDLDVLLDTRHAPPTSAHFLEAASILADAVGPDFKTIVARETKSQPGETTETHDAIRACEPRAIITFNYDTGHEAADLKHRPPGAGWETILASDPDVEKSEQQIRLALSADGLSRKLMKAHGSVEEPKSLVLTRESYRELLVRRPAYRAFLTQIFVNYSVVAVGFGMDDPDFQDSLDILARDIGGCLRRHMFVTGPPSPAKSPSPTELAMFDARRADQERRDVLMRRRYGFEALHCRTWDDVPSILRDLQTFAGPELRSAVEAAVDPDMTVREASHRCLGQLSESGSRRAVALISSRLKNEKDDWRASEWCFALGRMRPRTQEAKRLLSEEIERRIGLRRVALALISFVEYAQRDDLPWLRQQQANWIASPDPEEGTASDPKNRVRTYFEYVIQKTVAKFEAWTD